MRRQPTDHPLLYEINTRLWVREIAGPQGNRALDRVPQGALDAIARLHFDFVWLMGVWQTGPQGKAIALKLPQLRSEYAHVLPNWTPDDVLGSPYAVQDYRVADELGGPEPLRRLRVRLAERGIRLILDFVPNHTARDHPWVWSHPEFYIHGSEDDLRREPENFFLAETAHGKKVLACGRDPYFPPWTDTAQLNYGHAGMRAAMIETLLGIAAHSNGVRCDMSMLVLEEIFARTWGEKAMPADGTSPAHGEFWSEAIDAVRRKYPEFLFIAEAYWDLESRLQSLGFDYTYDKTLYDSLLRKDAKQVREHIGRDPDFHRKSVHFLENHDEPRAAQVFTAARHRAAALIAYTLPGIRLFHEGQLDGRRVRVPIQLGRRPAEEPEREVRAFYEKLLAALGDNAMRRGRWKLLEPKPAAGAGSTHEQILIHRWEGDGHDARVIAANYGSQPARCFAPLDLTGLRGSRVTLRDRLSEDAFERDGSELCDPGLFLDLAPYESHLFAVSWRD
ncbi:MAG: alpha-amylase [Deltaproteobacteria bacterium]|nr:alpha-amylase [Deltaproteobacteria bacterium]